jgi:hypothetical protein
MYDNGKLDPNDKILKIPNGIKNIVKKKPELIRIVSNVESDVTEEVAFTYHLLYTFSHAYHIHQRKVVRDNEWTGWLRMMISCFEQGKVREYWKSDLELEKWFDPEFQDFIDNEIVRKTSPKQEMQ